MDDGQLLDVYRRAWVLASTSQREGWGMTVTEAAACATPAVVSRIAGHLDAVEDGVSGLLADVGAEDSGADGRPAETFADGRPGATFADRLRRIPTPSCGPAWAEAGVPPRRRPHLGGHRGRDPRRPRGRGDGQEAPRPVAPVLAVGLTGGIGSGKSTVGELLVERGVVLIDADRIAREVVVPGGAAYQPLVDRFGTAVLAPDGTIDRAALAALAFVGAESVAALNAITHPAISAVMAQRRAAEEGTDGVVVLDIPLLKPEHRGVLSLAVVVVVDCPVEIAVDRLVGQRGFSREDAEARVAAQSRPRGAPGRAADFVIDNSSDRAHLVAEVDRVDGARPGRTAPPQCGGRAAPGLTAPAGRRAPTLIHPRYHRTVPRLEVVTPLRPAGDQPRAIEGLAAGIARGDRYQTLLGITGSGKTATIAWTIEAAQRPTLVIEPNKSLAAQLASELKELFPDNRVEYFVSYYDYYQPEAYIPSSDTYIEKDSSINDEIDRLRHATTSSLLTRRDVIVVASVSCIYGLGSPEEYSQRILALHPGDTVNQRDLLRKLVELHYDRNDAVLTRGHFRVRGDTVELHPAYEQDAVRIEMFGDQVERIRRFDALTGDTGEDIDELVVFSATHYGAGEETMRRAIASIEAELRTRLAELQSAGKLLEAQRLRLRTEHDLEMLAEVGVCSGIENYSRHLDGRKPGEPSHTLLDFFPSDFLTVIDESHVAVPQIHGQYEGDRSRKETLVEHGFRLPSALDNRPLTFDEFTDKVGQVVFLSATPGTYELGISSQVVDQVIRPTGLVDPEVVVQPTTGQIDDLMERIHKTSEAGGRTLVTTLTKKMAEDLTDYLLELGVRVRYLHSDIDTITRIELLRDLRLGEYDVLVGINLLREGLDLPEVQLVAILDADKTGFLRSASSLIQTMGRAARNVDGLVVLYADTITDAMRSAISETQRRRALQQAYNAEHGIDPTTIRKAVTDILASIRPAARSGTAHAAGAGQPGGPGPARARRRAGPAGAPGATARGGRRLAGRGPRIGDDTTAVDEMAELSALPIDEVQRQVVRLEQEMRLAAAELRYEEAALLRDDSAELRPGPGRGRVTHPAARSGLILEDCSPSARRPSAVPTA